MKLTAETLKEQRLAIGISQAEMARRAGISRATIIKYEKNIDLQITNILEAYCLEVYPCVGNLSGNIKEIKRIIEKLLKDNLGVNCKVKIQVEIGGEDK